MSKRDYYKVLGLSRNASIEEIKKAYRKKAIESHPDKHKGDSQAEEKFKEINEAYSVLSNQQKRTAYDNFGHQATGSPQGGGFNFSNFDMGDGKNPFSDFFEDAFGEESIFDSFFGQRSNQRNRTPRGADLKYEYEISLEEAYYGKKTEISFNKKVSCQSCSGTGAETGTKPVSCSHCNGLGQIRQNRGIFSINSTCYHCKGEGKVVGSPCYSCKGQGLVFEKKTLQVKIPAGINNEQSIKIPKEGEAVKGGEPGNLYISIGIKQHDYYERDGENLYVELPISVTQAVLGEKINFTTLSNKTIQIKIAPGTQNETMLRLKNEGMPLLNSLNYGNLFLKIKIKIPVKLKDKVKKLYEEIAKDAGDQKDINLNKRKKKSFFNF